MTSRKEPSRGLTVAVTGPTGEIGQAFVAALERSREVGSVLGMARKPFDPAARGWKKVSYRRGDVLDRVAVEQLVQDVDVVVHLAFMIIGGPQESRAVNLEGSRNVFAATVAAGAKRLVYASSVAAYGFHGENPQPLVEEVPARGTASHYYSAQKAEVEALLANDPQRERDRGVCLSPVHRRGAWRAAADRQPAVYADIRALAEAGPATARRRADPQAGAARSGGPISARPSR